MLISTAVHVRYLGIYNVKLYMGVGTIQDRSKMSLLPLKHYCYSYLGGAAN